MDNQQVLIVPEWVVSAISFLQRNWMALTGLLLIMVLTLTVTEIKKHKWNYKYDEAKAKSLVRWTVMLVSSGFTALGTVIYFIQNNQTALKSLPYIGPNELEVLGGLWALYNFRLSKGYKTWLARLSKWSAAKVSEPVVEPIPLPTPPATEVTL